MRIHTYVVTRDSVLALSILTNTILKKSLRLSNGGRSTWPGARIINLATVDTEALVDAALYVHFAWSSLFEIVLALIFLYFTIGSPFLAAVIIVIIYAPLNFLCSRLIRSLQILNGMKVVKLYAWEEPFEAEINRLRNEEVKLLTRSTLVSRVLQEINSVAPLLGLVCSRRLNEFFDAEELHIYKEKVPQGEHFTVSVEVQNAFFSWSKEKEDLKDITFNLKKNELNAIVGPTGSGKSSMLAAILGEMTLLDGHRKVSGTIGYVPQTPWILNDTIRANILFGNDFDKNKYDRVIRACDLKKDLYSLPRCDATMVGENGVFLSTGQCTRIALARALYQDCDIYLLDDPFSTVDSTIAKAMYDMILGPKGILSKKAVVLTTNRIALTQNADTIHIMQGLNGRIVDYGVYVELLLRSKIFSRLRNEMEPKIEEGINMSSEC
uniref:ABC transporter domain-containing protein n=1 Tax=Heterorhabditis bacteriophora TaxID=37862 RepID=A0A1I7XI47_HETBA